MPCPRSGGFHAGETRVPAHSDVTAMLVAARKGDQKAIDGLFAVLYDELHALATAQLARRGTTPTLNPTAILHETYLKLIGRGALSLQDRSHFFALAARAMRQVVVQHARRRLAGKRGAGVTHTLLDDKEIAIDENAASVLGLDAALERLHALDERLAQVVELNFFAGLSHEEIAELHAVTPRTVRRDWRKARAILHGELFGDGPPGNRST